MWDPHKVLKKDETPYKIFSPFYKKSRLFYRDSSESPLQKPKIINGSRKKRIAAGSGTVVSDINKILKQHRKMSDMMKKISKKGMGSLDPNLLSGQMGQGIPNDFLKK